MRRGGTLTDEHHRLLAVWAALCAEHVLHLFDEEQPRDTRPRDVINVGRAWVRGEVRMTSRRLCRARSRNWSDSGRSVSAPEHRAVARIGVDRPPTKTERFFEGFRKAC